MSLWRVGSSLIAVLLTACSATTQPRDGAVGIDAVATDTSRAIDATDAPPPCSAANCAAAGYSCRMGACVADCRPSDAIACSADAVCDYTDGQCRAPDAMCVLPERFTACPSPTGGAGFQCGPGLECDGHGACITTHACSGIVCEASGRCWARSCPCDRPTTTCVPPTLAQLNRAEFSGSLANGSDSEGPFALGFDDVCSAYVVTMISGPDYLRQMTADGTITIWQGTTNLNMGEIAVLRLPGGELTTSLGDVAGTYICCAACGCIETGVDQRQGVVRLDRTNMARPLPNLLPSTPTTGTGPFGDPSLDTGPYGLTYGADNALYIGNVHTNGDYMRVDLATGNATPVTMFPARVVAATLFDLQSLLVATTGGQIYQLNTAHATFALWTTLPGDATSIARDTFTGRVYAEVRTTPPQIVELQADGSGMTTVHTPPRLGRIAISPDGGLYHLSVYPHVNWMTHDSIVRWDLPAQR